MATCPYCGSKEPQPVEDGWWCDSCQREYPTRAYKCPHPDCWEYPIVCDRHRNWPDSAASEPVVAADNSTALVQTMAKAHRNKILAWLFASLVLSIFTGWISVWAGDKNGWEAQIVQFAFGLAGAVSLFTFLTFCVLLYSWIAGHKSAIRDSAQLLKDRDLYMHIHRDVFGPIPWR